MTKHDHPLNEHELGAAIVNTAIFDAIFKLFEEDVSRRFPEDYKEFSEHSMKFFDNPETARSRYNEALRKFLEIRGYGSRFYRLSELITSAIQQESSECSLAFRHMEHTEIKKKVSKQNYAKFVKAN